MASVLIADDDDQIRALLRAVLEAANHRVVEARDGSEALVRYREAPTDLLIVDLYMPEKDGLETIMDFQREFPEARTKIIALTGGSTTGWDPTETLKVFNVQRILEKPFEMPAFLEIVAEILQGPNGGNVHG